MVALIILVIPLSWACFSYFKSTSIHPGAPAATESMLPSGIVLPADPGEAGKLTLAGIDSDGDRVRDDIQHWIVFEEPTSERMRQALYQEARAMQEIISGGSSSAFDDFDRASTCLFGMGDKLQISPDDLAKLSHKLIVQFLNTDARAKAYLMANNLANGRTGLPIKLDNRVAECAFDPDALPN